MSKSGKRILCIEDDTDTCELLATWLGLFNCEVTAASTATRGLELARQRNFDLYLVDARLPDGTGFDVCHRIRAFDRQTPILFWSADDEGLHEAHLAGAQAFIAKPIDPVAFLDTINQLLDTRSTSAKTPQ